MMKTTHALLATATVALLLAGCASKPKPPPGVGPGGISEAAPRTELPSAGTRDQDGASSAAQQSLAQTAGDRVFFALDSDALDEEALETLRRQAGWLRTHSDVRARIAGNADERGTREYNLALGARRAAAARQMLMASGVEATRLETISYGKERPLEAGSNEDAWARNRNAQTVVIGMTSP